MTAAGFDADVVIVGGGPAGASVALHLVRAEGIAPERITILDKARFPREKPCAGAISAWGLEVLRSLSVPLGVAALPMTGLRILAGGVPGRHVAPGLGALVRRDAFDAHLLGTARRGGVAVHEGEAVVACEPQGGGVRVRTSARALTARHVVACDGAGSTVRKVLGLREPARKGHLYVLETPLGPADGALVQGLCDFDLTPHEDGVQGYYWDFPTPLDGVRSASRGIYHANFAASASLKSALRDALALRGIDIDAVRLKPFSTRPFVPGTTLSHGGVLFVGEAAGIDATTGEGIAQALLMGGLAARALGAGLRRGVDVAARYDAEMRPSLLVRRLLQSAWLAPRVYGKGGAPFRRLLGASPSARAAGAQWYEGQRLGLRTKVRLASGLAGTWLAEALGRRPSSPGGPSLRAPG